MNAASARGAVESIFKQFEPTRRLREANEARTRIEIIDAVLASVGWPQRDVELETASGTGDFLDYELCTEETPWMVLEAKRTGQTFDISDAESKRGRSQLRAISGLLKSGGTALRDAMKQAASYCNDRGIPLVCLTNGFQWIFFRGLSSKNRSWTSGSALVFAGPDDVLARFDDFLRCLGRAWAGTPHLPELLDGNHEEPLRTPIVPRDLLATRKANIDTDRTAVLRSVSSFLLGDIYGDDRQEMLERCYVVPGNSGDFEHSIDRLLRDTERTLPDEPHEVLGGDPNTFVDTLSRQVSLSPIQHPVVVVGHVGVGKTTFLQRSLSRFRENRSAFYSLVDLEGHGHGGALDARAEEQRLAKLILDKLANSSSTVLRHYGISGPELDQANPNELKALRAMLHAKLQEEKKLGAKVWDAEPTAWDKREYELFTEFRSDPVNALVRYIRHLRGRFKKFPSLIVLDNLDQAHEDYQRAIYGFGQRLARETQAVVVLCIREDTYRAGRENDGFLSSSPLHFVFHVARPPLDRLLRQRVQYGESASAERLLPAGLHPEEAVVGEVCDFLRRTVLTQGSDSLNLFAGLAGHNMRDALALIRSLVEGWPTARATPGPDVAFAFDCLLASQGHAGLRSRCRISNCFDAEPTSPPLHGLRLRLLAHYSWAFDSVSERAFLEGTDTAIGHFASWGYPVSAVRNALFHLLEDGLLSPLDWQNPERSDMRSLPTHTRLTASGYVHLTRLSILPAYRAAMACTTRWYDHELAQSFIKEAARSGGAKGTTIGDIAESAAVSFFDAYLASMLDLEDGRLAAAMSKQPWSLEVRSRAGSIVPRTKVPSVPPQVEQERLAKTPAPHQDQLDIGFAGQVRPHGELPTLRRDREYKGTVWIPRILWALEWARLNGKGPLSPADMARVLADNGQLDVPRNNVARAFRDLRGDERCTGLWRGIAKRYEISQPGTLLIQALLKDD